MGDRGGRSKSRPPVHTKPQSSVLKAGDRPAPNTAVTHFEAEFEAAIFKGPLPPPEVLARYEEICPGATDRVLSMAESQARHRQRLEERVVTSNCRAQDRGPILGFILALAVLGFGAYLILQGKEVSGLVALVSALVAIVVPFIYGKRVQNRELQKKKHDLMVASGTSRTIQDGPHDSPVSRGPVPSG
jgi:uncharacterized membrane protein